MIAAVAGGFLRSLLHRGPGLPGPQWYGLTPRMRETPPRRQVLPALSNHSGGEVIEQIRSWKRRHLGSLSWTRPAESLRRSAAWSMSSTAEYR